MLRGSSFALVGLAVAATSVSYAQSGERWTCYDLTDFGRETPLIELTGAVISEELGGLGIVTVGTASYVASFDYQGLNRRWNFGETDDDGAYPYSFVITPAGAGSYYDFSGADDSGRTSQSQSYECEYSEIELPSAEDE